MQRITARNLLSKVSTACCRAQTAAGRKRFANVPHQHHAVCMCVMACCLRLCVFNLSSLAKRSHHINISHHKGHVCLHAGGLDMLACTCHDPGLADDGAATQPWRVASDPF